MRKSIGRAMFETAQLMTQQNAALSNPQSRDLKPVETVLTPEQRAARRQAAINQGWQALHEKYQREAGDRKTF